MQAMCATIFVYKPALCAIIKHSVPLLKTALCATLFPAWSLLLKLYTAASAAGENEHADTGIDNAFPFSFCEYLYILCICKAHVE